jgi:hypothetical protein
MYNSVFYINSYKLSIFNELDQEERENLRETLKANNADAQKLQKELNE